jgi:hypothetical protein
MRDNTRNICAAFSVGPIRLLRHWLSWWGLMVLLSVQGSTASTARPCWISSLTVARLPRSNSVDLRLPVQLVAVLIGAQNRPRFGSKLGAKSFARFLSGFFLTGHLAVGTQPFLRPLPCGILVSLPGLALHQTGTSDISRFKALGRQF